MDEYQFCADRFSKNLCATYLKAISTNKNLGLLLNSYMKNINKLDLNFIKPADKHTVK
jgi:hypothetical protein